MQRVAASGRTVVSVWGIVAKEGLSPLVRIQGKFRAERYCDILKDVALPYLAHGPFPDEDYVFQHDRSPVHTAKKVEALL